ncbi:MAG TPA: hypothetical protein VFV94_13260, partial [Polyangiaceae bacterium]|nr:hypothetical protein [Polyangiaceae bacterium]
AFPAPMPDESNRSRALLYGVFLALLVFCVGVLEALVFPGAYRAVALVGVNDSAAGARATDPLRLARMVEEATLDAPLLAELVSARSARAAGGEDARPVTALSVLRDVRISSADARTFEVSFTDASPSEAERLCGLVVRRALERAPAALADGRGPEKGGAMVRARVVSPIVRHGWPEGYQRLLIVLGALGGVVAGASATWLRLRAAPVLQPVLPLEPLAPGPVRAAGPSPGATLPLAPPATPRMPKAPGTAPASVEPPPTTDRMEPMAPAPAAVEVPAALLPQPGRSYTPAGIGAPAVAMPRRRSTLILGSPVLPSPVPARPTPTSLAKPSSLPAPSLFPAGSSSQSPPVTSSSDPPPARISSRPPPASLSAPSSQPFERARGRYSYVSTPVPQAEPPKVHERQAPFDPDPTLRTELHKPWRRQLFTLGVAQCFVTAVTSVGAARRAKARLAAELAFCLAETGHARVLLVEADFPEPEIRRLLRVEILDAESVVRQTSTPGRTGPWSVLRLSPSLHALVQASPAQPELVLGDRFRECVISLCASYDFVVLNGPPLETGVPFRSLLGWVDGLAIATESSIAPGVAEARILAQGKAFLEVHTASEAVR